VSHFGSLPVKVIHFREDFGRGMFGRGIKLQNPLPIPLPIIPLPIPAFGSIFLTEFWRPALRAKRFAVRNGSFALPRNVPESAHGYWKDRKDADNRRFGAVAAIACRLSKPAQGRFSGTLKPRKAFWLGQLGSVQRPGYGYADPQ